MKNPFVCFVFSVSSVECSVCVGGLVEGEGAACNSNPAPPLLACWILQVMSAHLLLWDISPRCSLPWVMEEHRGREAL